MKFLEYLLRGNRCCTHKIRATHKAPLPLNALWKRFCSKPQARAVIHQVQSLLPRAMDFELQ